MDQSGWVCLLDRDILNDVVTRVQSWKFNLCSTTEFNQSGILYRDILSGSIIDGDILGDVATKFYQTVLDLTRVSNEK